MHERITLRLKSNPATVVPEGGLIGQNDNSFRVDFESPSSLAVAPVEFPKLHWEPVPPPYTLPDGIGAVVRGPLGGIYTHVGERQWLSPGGSGVTSNEDLLGWGGLTTLSEGVSL